MAVGGEPRRRGDSEQTARRVVEAAAAEFIERGYDAAVISNIARRAGVTPGAIYPRWPHKSDLMVAALDHIFEQLLPEQRMKDMGIAGLSTSDVLALWASNVLASDDLQDVLVQVFGSARNNAAVRERLERFLNDQADQFHSLVERAKDEGLCDPDLDSVAVTLLLQAAGIGTHLVLSAGLADRHIPSVEDWVELVLQVARKVNGAVELQTPPDQ